MNNHNKIQKEGSSILHSGYNQFDINTSDYNTGTYVYNIIIDGKLIKSGKFNKVR